MYEKNKLYDVLLKKHMSCRDLARLSGISKSEINKIENFESDPKQSTMIAIARALNMEVIDIFNFKWRK